MYPTEEQEVLLVKSFGCARYVYNRGLAIKMAMYQGENKGVSIFDLMKETKKDDSEPTTRYEGDGKMEGLRGNKMA